MWKNKKVLIAGGTGLIGIQLTSLLQELGAHIRVASLDDPSRLSKDIEFCQLDLTNVENCRTACKDIEYVFNLLGVKASPKMTKLKPASHYYPTIMLEHCLLEAARLEKVEGFQLTSSIGVYSPADIMYEESVWETMPSRNDWFAGWAKRVGELQVEAYRIEYGMKNLTITRPANIYGPWDNFDSENAMVVPSLIKKAFHATDTLQVWGDGTPVRDFLHAKDVARAMILVAEKNPQEPINIGSGTGYSIKELAESVCQASGKDLTIQWITDAPSGDKKRILATSRLQSLGFKQSISLQKGIQDLYDWYTQNHDLTDSRYDIFSKEK